VDDNQFVGKAFEGKLKASGFEVVIATDSASAIRAARERAPEIIILDLNLPSEQGVSGLAWDGITLLQWFKRNLEMSQIPIIMFTVEEPMNYKEKALAAGAAAFFQKPARYQELLEMILHLLGDKPEQTPYNAGSAAKPCQS